MTHCTLPIWQLNILKLGKSRENAAQPLDSLDPLISRYEGLSVSLRTHGFNYVHRLAKVPAFLRCGRVARPGDLHFQSGPLSK